MLKNRAENNQNAEVIALKALAFLASDEQRLARFLDATGLSLEAIRGAAADPAFLAGVFDYLRADQTLLFEFAEAEGLAPEAIDRARLTLPGSADDI